MPFPTDIEIEILELSFSNENSQVATFASSFSYVPRVTVISTGNENMYVSDVTKNSCTVNSSVTMTGTVQVHVLGYYP